jgi:hypothetical protein
MTHPIPLVPTTLSLHLQGFNKSKRVHMYELINNWELYNVNEGKTVPLLYSYFLLYWQGSYLKRTIKDGTIRDLADIPYIVVWYNCKPHEAFRAEQVAISFRASAIGNFALVKLA